MKRESWSEMGSMIQFRVDAKMRRNLIVLARQERRTLSNYIRLLVEKAIEENKPKTQAV